MTFAARVADDFVLFDYWQLSLPASHAVRLSPHFA
jgi:hypothetical protein